MSQILDQIANSRLAYLTGTDGPATVPPGAFVVAWTASAPLAGAATVDITASGPLQKPIALSTITIPAGKSDGDDQVFLRLGADTAFTFTGTDAYRISIAYPGGAS